MTNTLLAAGPARAAQRRAPSPGGILAIVLTGQFMALLDASVTNVAAPAIHASLHASGPACSSSSPATWSPTRCCW